MLITMLGTTIATNGHTLAEGQSVEVGDEFGQHLIDSGIASAAAGRTATATGKGREEQQKQNALQNLEIAKRHGDVEAALKLDRIARGEEEVQVEPTPEPTPEPEPEPTPAPEPETGASARRSLSRQS